jgi:hypothetical protein
MSGTTAPLQPSMTGRPGHPSVTNRRIEQNRLEHSNRISPHLRAASRFDFSYPCHHRPSSFIFNLGCTGSNIVSWGKRTEMQPPKHIDVARGRCFNGLQRFVNRTEHSSTKTRRRYAGTTSSTDRKQRRKNGARGGSRTHMRKNPRRILSPQRLPFRHPGEALQTYRIKRLSATQPHARPAAQALRCR